MNIANLFVNIIVVVFALGGIGLIGYLFYVFYKKLRVFLKMDIISPQQQKIKPEVKKDSKGKFCKDCGTKLGEGVSFCSKCGGKVV